MDSSSPSGTPDHGGDDARAETERARRRVDLVDEAYFEATLQGEITYANRAWYALFGDDPSGLPADPLTTYFHPDCRDEFALYRDAALSSAKTLRQEFRVQH
ncbi:MAG: hypothetical protein RLZZ200_1294, partial [Pseudomonadota bacterium]